MGLFARSQDKIPNLITKKGFNKIRGNTQKEIDWINSLKRLEIKEKWLPVYKTNDR